MVRRLGNGSLFGRLGVALFMGAASGWAGGFKIQDQSTRAMGMIDAFIAGADDASAVYYNPAGLTRLAGPQLIGNLYLARGQIHYDGVGGSDSSVGRLYALPSVYFGMPLDAAGDWVAGFGAYYPFGLGTRWRSRSPVAFYSTVAEISLLNLNPSLAYRVTDRLSLGVGVDYYLSSLVTRRLDMATGGEVELAGRGDGWGYNLGLQYQCSDRVTLGLTYRSQVVVDHRGDASFDGLGLKLDAESDLDYPAMLGAGICWQATPKLRVEFATEWVQWSTRDRQAIHFEVPPGWPLPAVLEQPVNWRDSWVFMLGAEYWLSERWALRCGYGFNQTPVPSSIAEPSLPAGDTHAVSLGVGCQLSKALSVDLATVLAYSEKNTLKSPNAPYDSDYESWGTFVSLGLTWNF